MNNHLAALRENIVAEIAAAYPDFHFFTAAAPDGNLTIDYRGTWEPEPTPDPHHVPFLTIKHDGDRFLVSHYLWNEGRKYKTLKGASKYIDDELKNSCDRLRKRKAEDDAKRDFSEKSAQQLREFHGVLANSGIESRLYLDGRADNHLSLYPKGGYMRIDVFVTPDYRLQVSFDNPRIVADAQRALEIIAVFSPKEAATA